MNGVNPGCLLFFPPRLLLQRPDETNRLIGVSIRFRNQEIARTVMHYDREMHAKYNQVSRLWTPAR